jgi:hypothetical protein
MPTIAAMQTSVRTLRARLRSGRRRALSGHATERGDTQKNVSIPRVYPRSPTARARSVSGLGGVTHRYAMLDFIAQFMQAAARGRCDEDAAVNRVAVGVRHSGVGALRSAARLSRCPGRRGEQLLRQSLLSAARRAKLVDPARQRHVLGLECTDDGGCAELVEVSGQKARLAHRRTGPTQPALGE